MHPLKTRVADRVSVLCQTPCRERLGLYKNHQLHRFFFLEGKIVAQLTTHCLCFVCQSNLFMCEGPRGFSFFVKMTWRNLSAGANSAHHRKKRKNRRGGEAVKRSYCYPHRTTSPLTRHLTTQHDPITTTPFLLTRFSHISSFPSCPYIPSLSHIGSKISYTKIVPYFFFSLAQALPPAWREQQEQSAGNSSTCIKKATLLGCVMMVNTGSNYFLFSMAVFFIVSSSSSLRLQEGRC